MAVSGYGDRTAVSAGGDSLTYRDLGRLAAAGAELIDRIGADSVIYIGPSHPAFRSRCLPPVPPESRSSPSTIDWDASSSKA